jgi:flagellar biosynthesis protein FlhA
LKYQDIFVSLLVVAIIFLMILPVPTFVLDALQIVNIALSLLIILSTMYVRTALELSSFPSILLVITMLRLSLNVTSTRLILLNGKNFDGKVVRTFGNFVVGGNYIVGLIIFLILVIIQFIVITKGAERISEVGARFTLDAMPGKQMSVDADYNAGLITEDEARKKREDIRREADFYGAMDGASKFVRGDAIAGIIIVFVNIIGGLLIGVVQQGMEIGEAAAIFTLLTVGDGLASQIPSLLISTASGILVSRSASESNLGNDLVKELTSENRVLYLTGGVLLVLTLFTPLPTFIGIIIGGGLMLIAFFSSRTEKETATQSAEPGGGTTGGFSGLQGPPPAPIEGAGGTESQGAPAAPSLTSAEEVSEIIQSDTLDVEFGYGILPLADPGQGGDLLDRITMVRKQTAYELGLILSPIRVRDSVLLKANEYMIKLKGTELTKYELWPDRLLAINPGTAQGALPGITSREPAFGLDAYWIDETQREQATTQGYTVVDPPSVFATHFSEIVKQHAHDLLGRKEMDLLLKGLKENFNELVDEVIPDLLKVYEMQRILQNLLEERVSIRNLPVIFETISEFAEKTRDLDYLTEFSRRALKRQICVSNRSDDGQIHAVGLDPNLERQLGAQIREMEDERYLALNPDTLQQLIDKISKGVEKIMQNGHMPVIVCSGSIRIYLRRAVERSLQSIAVMSYEELVEDIPFSVETVIKL